MYIRKHSKLYKNVSKENIWKVWIDVNNWPSWHDDLDYCKLEGKFEKGNFFILKPKKMRTVKIELIEVQEGKSFTDCTKFFGAKMCDTHAMEETKEGLLITNTLTVTGPLKWLWIKLVAKHVADSIPGKVDALVKVAQLI